MTAFTHAFVNSTKQTITLEQLREIIIGADPAARAKINLEGFCLIRDLDRVVYDAHGRLSHAAGGWSYGHIQHGHICAGAGGLNSFPVIRI